MNKPADRQLRRAATGLYALMAASRRLSEASWLTDTKEMEPDMAAVNYLYRTLCILKYKCKYGAKPTQSLHSYTCIAILFLHC